MRPLAVSEELKHVRSHSDRCLVRAADRIRGIAERVRRRLEGEEGFTLVELTIVLLVLGILMTIAVPSYLSFKDRASKTAAKADVAQVLKAVAAYDNDNYPGSANDPNATTTDSGYSGITLAALATKYDASISTIAGAPFVINPAGFTGTSTDFCLTAAVGRWVAAQHGPGSTISVGTLFTPGTCTVS
jgi:prepilin-type N-terminal cleavage/methylation domain-containing protein